MRVLGPAPTDASARIPADVTDVTAEMVRDAVLHSKVSPAYVAGPDLCNYRADFSTLEENFPELSLRWSVGGIEQLICAYIKHGLTYDDFRSSRFVRLRRIRQLLSVGIVGEMPRRQHGAQFLAPGTHAAHTSH